jgi:hypothetical protein
LGRIQAPLGDHGNGRCQGQSRRPPHPRSPVKNERGGCSPLGHWRAVPLRSSAKKGSGFQTGPSLPTLEAFSWNSSNREQVADLRASHVYCVTLPRKAALAALSWEVIRSLGLVMFVCRSIVLFAAKLGDPPQRGAWIRPMSDSWMWSAGDGLMVSGACLALMAMIVGYLTSVDMQAARVVPLPLG